MTCGVLVQFPDWFIRIGNYLGYFHEDLREGHHLFNSPKGGEAGRLISFLPAQDYLSIKNREPRR